MISAHEVSRQWVHFSLRSKQEGKLNNRGINWSDWFTFVIHPNVKPDNKDAERALRPVVEHCKGSWRFRSNWSGQAVSSANVRVWRRCDCRAGMLLLSCLNYLYAKGNAMKVNIEYVVPLISNDKQL